LDCCQIPQTAESGKIFLAGEELPNADGMCSVRCSSALIEKHPDLGVHTRPVAEEKR